MQPALLSEPLRRAGAPLLRLQTDQRLVRLVRAGSHPAFTEVVHRYRPALERYTGRIVGAEQAEDVVQQAFANAHTALMTDDRHVELKPWLYRIVHNAALNVMRGRHEVVALHEHEHELVVQGVEAQAEDRERFRSTLRAVQALPPAQRDALLLRELEGRSHEEIAAALGVSAGAARQHLMRARATVRSVVTAVTPYPAVLKLAAMAGDGGGASAARAVAGGGAGLTLSKLGAGILAAGAVAGGAGVVVPAVVPGSAPKPAEAADRPRQTVLNPAGISIAARAAAAAGLGAAALPAFATGHGARELASTGRRNGAPGSRDRSGTGGDDGRGDEASTAAPGRDDREHSAAADGDHRGGGEAGDDEHHHGGVTSSSGQEAGTSGPSGAGSETGSPSPSNDDRPAGDSRSGSSGSGSGDGGSDSFVGGSSGGGGSDASGSPGSGDGGSVSSDGSGSGASGSTTAETTPGTYGVGGGTPESGAGATSGSGGRERASGTGLGGALTPVVWAPPAG